ncbi:MAG: methylmalonyl-CoA mutase family protein [Thermodesulfobacteriota bacterium]|nr:methylmalonyl-CoA mutase family protein [Thermodesulfobacteriota bacterium]
MFKEELLKEIERLNSEYETNVKEILKRFSIEEEKLKTMSGLPLKPVYTPLDIKNDDFLKDISFPGLYPYTRGITPLGYRTKDWTVRQVVGLGTAEETNERLKYLFNQGQTGFSVCGMGYQPYESSDERTFGMLGRGGVWIDTLADIETLFDGIDMSKISINQIGFSIPVFAMIITEAKRKDTDLKTLSGTIQNIVFPLGEGFEIKGNGSVDIIEYCAKNLPKWNHTSISVRNNRDEGISAPYEIAFGIYLGAFTLQSVMSRGLDVDQIAPRISFFLSSENDFLEEVAKFRAIRRLWARTVKERFKAKNPRSWLMRFHVQTTALNLTAQQPLNNIIRSTIHALAAVLGGAQSMSVNSFDEALAVPTKASATLSLRTQQIIALESGASNVLDPLGGSYCIESLTDQLEERAIEILNEMEAIPPHKIYQYIKDKGNDACYDRQKAIDNNEMPVVGVNRFNMEEEIGGVDQWSVDLLKYDSTWREKQIKRLNRVKQERDPQKAEKAKKILEDAYREKVNIIEPMMEAVQAYLSIGEIVKVREKVYGPANLDHIMGCFFGM